MKKSLVVAIFAILFSFFNVQAQTHELEECRIVIDIPSRTLFYLVNDKIIKEYPVAVGKSYSQTPIGEFKVMNKIINPYYIKGNIPGGSPDNPLGSRWIGFKPSYGIHGNNNPDSIGTSVSAGCVRMYDKDVKELYEKVSVGLPVKIKYELIKTVNDIYNNNVVVVIYPDIYNKEKDLIEKVNNKLKETGILDKIKDKKIEKLRNLINKEVVYFSDNWIYLINGNYITSDIISVKDELHVNIDDICKFFNINIKNRETNGYLNLFGNIVPIETKYNNRYISIDLLEKCLGGKHSINQVQEIIDYNFNFIIFNNRLISGEVLNIEGESLLSLESIQNIFNRNIRVHEERKNIIIANKEIKYESIEGEKYIKLDDFLKQTHFRSDINTKNKYIQIVSNPYICLNKDFFKRELYSEILFFKQIFQKNYIFLKY